MDSFDLAIIEFNAQQFYESHELLELLWHDAPPIERNFYQGLLQIAAGFYHLQQKNENGAKILIGEGIHRLKQYPDHYHGWDLGTLVIKTQPLLSALQRSEKLPAFPRLVAAPRTD